MHVGVSALARDPKNMVFACLSVLNQDWMSKNHHPDASLWNISPSLNVGSIWVRPYWVRFKRLKMCKRPDPSRHGITWRRGKHVVAGGEVHRVLSRCMLTGTISYRAVHGTWRKRGYTLRSMCGGARVTDGMRVCSPRMLRCPKWLPPTWRWIQR